jgi:hypothetical protein
MKKDVISDRSNIIDKQYIKNMHHYERQRIWMIIIFSILESALIVFAVLGFAYFHILFLGGICVCHAVVIPFIFFKNFRLISDMAYFGFSNISRMSNVIIHFLCLLGIELGTIGISLLFIQPCPFPLIALSVFSVFVVVLLLVLERITYPNANEQIYIDKNLYKK